MMSASADVAVAMAALLRSGDASIAAMSASSARLAVREASGNDRAG